jgi:glycosyltransferase involved in cell wall biosynthesis
MHPGDVVVAKTDPPLLSVAIAPVVRRRRALLVNWLQDVFPEVASGVRPGRLAQWLQRPLMFLRDRSLRQACMNVVLGAGMQDYLRGRGVPESRLRIVENWAVGETMHPVSTEASQLRRSLAVGDRLVVGYSGNLGLAHDHETILAAAMVLRDDPGIVFLMVGGGAGMGKLKSAAQACGLDNLRFLPYQPREQLADSLAAADVHLVTQLPSVEGFVVPSKLYGVMAAGRPVIFVGDTAGEVARTIGRAECGSTIANGDGPRLAAELQRLRNDAALRARLGVNAAGAYRANYSFEAAAGRWLELLQGVVASGPDR